MKIQFFVPHPSKHVRDPRTELVVPIAGIRIATEGEPYDPFWARRVRDGDGVIVLKDPDEATEAEETDE